MPFVVANQDAIPGRLDRESTAVLVHAKASVRLSSIIFDLWILSKPEINFLIALATFTGLCLGHVHHSDPFPLLLSLRTICGTVLVAGGTATLNQYVERHFDAQMRRTALRPLATGRVKPSAGRSLGLVMVVAGSAYLAVAVNALTGALAIATVLGYLLVYTPLKRRSSLCTLIGALPGATPPLIGWAAAAGRLQAGAWVLYAILLLWQIPHFMAIAWIYREDYERAGYRVLPPVSRRSVFVNWMIVVPLVILMPVSILPLMQGNAGALYKCGALLASGSFLYLGALLAIHKSNLRARRLLLASVVYLPLLFLLLIATSIWPR